MWHHFHLTNENKHSNNNMKFSHLHHLLWRKPHSATEPSVLPSEESSSQLKSRPSTLLSEIIGGDSLQHVGESSVCSFSDYVSSWLLRYPFLYTSVKDSRNVGSRSPLSVSDMSVNFCWTRFSFLCVFFVLLLFYLLSFPSFFSFCMLFHQWSNRLAFTGCLDSCQR
jgi:hypothetical protein